MAGLVHVSRKEKIERKILGKQIVVLKLSESKNRITKKHHKQRQITDIFPTNVDKVLVSDSVM